MEERRLEGDSTFIHLQFNNSGAPAPVKFYKYRMCPWHREYYTYYVQYIMNRIQLRNEKKPP